VLLAAGCGGSDDGSESNGSGATASTPTGSAGTLTTGCVPGEAPDGAACECDEECASNKCYVIELLRNYCSECLTDADCPSGGCSLPNIFGGTGASCNQGELGGGCETSDVCQDDLVCTDVIDVSGVGMTIQTCSECVGDADCEGELLCSPQVELGDMKGQKICVEPGSVQDGEACDLEGTGDDACASGMCAVLDVSGMVQFGVCGECKGDGDCGPDETCILPTLDLNTGGITPSICSGDGTGTGSTGTGGTGTGTTSG
jgi:hypothetical protein